MKRLLICSRSHSPHGGADRIIADLCRQLPKRSWAVTLGLTQGSRFNDVRRYVEVMGDDLPVREIDGREGTRAGRLRALRNLIRDEQPDVVLSMRVFDAYEAVALEKARSGAGPRLAVGVRSFEPPYLADLATYRDSIDLCVASGELIAKLATGFCGMEPSRVVSIGGGVHPPIAPGATRHPRQPIRLLYAGRIDDEQKRMSDLPPFLDELERQGIDYVLDIAGVGPAEGELRSRLQSRVHEGKVAFHGWLDQGQLYRTLYPQADCFLHFAAWEGMTIAPREAMAHGAVPVVSRFPGQRLEAQFRDGETALTFPIGDTRAAADCVARLLDEDGLLERLSANARDSQTGVYSFEGSMDAWARAFDGCLAQPVRVGPLPVVPERRSGRLSRLGVPASVQAMLRGMLGRTLRHSSPGSEWPTASGTMDERTREELGRIARQLDEGVAGA